MAARLVGLLSFFCVDLRTAAPGNGRGSGVDADPGTGTVEAAGIPGREQSRALSPGAVSLGSSSRVSVECRLNLITVFPSATKVSSVCASERGGIEWASKGLLRVS
jgi:hypothetical protein